MSILNSLNFLGLVVEEEEALQPGFWRCGHACLRAGEDPDHLPTGALSGLSGPGRHDPHVLDHERSGFGCFPEHMHLGKVCLGLA